MHTTVESQIDECLTLLQTVLRKDLLGVYLYGSASLGGLQRYSDIDLFVVSNRPTTLDEKKKLITGLLQISGLYGSLERRPIELTIVVKSDINPWQYPPRFDFQYGDWLRKEFESGVIEPWKSKEMPDLAILITKVLLSSKTLYGSKPAQLLAPVPYHDFITSLVAEIDSLLEDLEGDTRNVLLTLARIWRTVETDTICSKQSAAEWAINRMPAEYKSVLEHAILIAQGKKDDTWEELHSFIIPCAKFMVDKIQVHVHHLASIDTPQRTISVE